MGGAYRPSIRHVLALHHRLRDAKPDRMRRACGSHIPTRAFGKTSADEEAEPGKQHEHVRLTRILRTSTQRDAGVTLISESSGGHAGSERAPRSDGPILFAFGQGTDV